MLNWKWPNSHFQPIGLDIGSSSVKMIQLAIENERVRVVAADKVRIDSDVNTDAQARRHFIVSAIKRILAENNFHGRSVVSNLPNGDMKITSLRLSEQEEEKIVQALQKEAAVRFGLKADKDMIDYIVAGAIQQGEEVKNELIVFAASDIAICEHIKMLEEAKLKPVGIDAVPCALYRNSMRFLRRQEDKEHAIVLIDIGGQYTTVVFSRGGEISFVKQIDIGVEKFNQQIASCLKIGVKDAEMLRGAMRIERMSAVPAVAGALSGLNISSEFSAMKQSSERCESAHDAETEDSEDLPDGESNTNLDSATRQKITDVISLIAEELTHEISLCLKYYTVTFRGNRVERAIVTGGGAYEKVLLDGLKRCLGFEVEIGQPLRGFDVTEVRTNGFGHDILCEWAVAVGLSLKGYNAIPCVERRGPVDTRKRAFDNKDNYERN